jgi:hypothetical protein
MRNMTNRVVAVVAVIAAIIGVIVVSTLRQRVPEYGTTATVPCAPLENAEVATLQLLLPTGWTIERTAVHDADRTRPGDGAPVTFVAAWIRDGSGARVTDEPALYVWEGGTLRAHADVPKSHYVLNDAAARITLDTAEAGARGDIRRTTRDARTLPEPYSPEDPAARAAADCLRD